MSPPIHKDWWLAAALTGAALPAALAQPANADARTGVVTSVTQSGTSRPTNSTMYLDAASGQRLSTGPNQTLHVLFSDQSALTVGPNSEVVIAQYRYDTQKKEGNVLVDLTKGLLRVVGGFISKKNETLVRTATSTIGIRGGITIIEHEGRKTSGVFLFGESMRMTDNDGNEQTITRPGFGVTYDNGTLGQPTRSEGTQLSSLLNRLEGTPAPTPTPTPAPGPTPVPTPSPSGEPEDTLANDRLKDDNNALDNTDPLKKLLKSNPPPGTS